MQSRAYMLATSTKNHHMQSASFGCLQTYEDVTLRCRVPKSQHLTPGIDTSRHRGPIE